MKIVEPPPNIRVGPRRDDLLAAEVVKFEAHTFFLDSVAARDRGARPSRVKCYASNDIPWANGNGNVIAPPKEPPKIHKKVIGARIPDELMPKYFRSDAVEKERDAQAQMMEHSRLFADNFSPQHPERLHKIMPQPVLPPEHRRGDAYQGFKGLGETASVVKQGKAMVPETTYDPLGLRHWGPRVTGLRRLPLSSYCTLEDGTLCHNDGIPFDASIKKTIPRAHRHRFPVNFGPEADLEGFSGMGTSDVAPPCRGRKHHPRTWVDYASYQRSRTTEPGGASGHFLPPLSPPQKKDLPSVTASVDVPFSPGQGVVLYHPAVH